MIAPGGPVLPDLPTVSVLIVNYRSYDELAVCLAAVLDESRNVRLDVTVVDQESDPAALSKIRERFPPVTLIPNPRNDGFAAGVNRAAREAPGRHLLLVNPDTVVSPGLVQGLAAYLDAHPEVAVVGPRILNADGTLQPSARRFPDLTTGMGGRTSWLTRVAPENWLSRRNLDYSRVLQPIHVDWVSGACMMVRREAFQGAGGMDEGFFLYWEDADFCRRLLSAGRRAAYVPTVSAVHTGSRASRHAAARSLVAFHRSAFRYYWKHSGLVGRACAPIVQVLLWGRLVVKLALLGWHKQTT
jgi:N-acetylglucosaminyl-diphospho-decaprenol L-rhamnosyltransferase